MATVKTSDTDLGEMDEKRSLIERAVLSLETGIIVIDRNEKTAFSNPYAEELLGTSQGHSAIDPSRMLLDATGFPIGSTELPWIVTLRTKSPVSSFRLGVLRSPDEQVAWCDIDTAFVEGDIASSSGYVAISIAPVCGAVTTELQIPAILERIGDAFYTLDAQWRFSYVNRQAELLLRLKATDLIGRSVWEIFPDIRETELASAFCQVAESHHASSLELFYPPFESWFEVRIYPAADGLSVYYRDISDRYRAERALMVSEAQYRSVIEQIPAVIYTETPDFERTLAYVSPFVETLLGFPPEEFLATRGLWTRCIHPDDRERVHGATDNAKVTREPYSLEYRLISADQRIVWVDDRAELISDASGERLWWQGVALDITERRLAQQRVSESEERFRTLVQHAADLVSVIGPDGSILYQSPALERVLGYLPEERSGQQGLSFIHPDDSPVAQQILAELAGTETGTTAKLDLRARHKDGSWRFLEATAANLISEPSIRGFVINSRDITERKVLENALREREARHKALLTAIPDPILRLDRAGTYRDIEVNNFVELIAPKEFLLGRTVAEFVPEEIASRIISAISAAIDEADMKTLEYQLSREEGVRDFEMRLVASGSEEVVGLVRDITDQRLAEARLEKSEERLRLALRSAGMGAWDLHMPTDTVVWSPTLCVLLGLPAESRTTTTDEYRAQFVHPDDVAHASAAKFTSNTGVDFIEIEYRIIRPDGEVRWLIDIGSVVERAEDKSAIRSTGVTIDVTALRESEAALRLRDRALSAALDGIVIADMNLPDQPVIDVNSAFCEITGYSSDDVLGKNCRFLLGPGTDLDTVKTIRLALAEGRAVTSTLLNYRKDGTPFWNELHLSPVRDSNEQLTHVVGVVHDVTERRAAERELSFQAELLDQATVAVIATDSIGVVTHWNRHAEVLYGWSSREAIGQSIVSLSIGPSEKETAATILERLRRGLSWEGDFTCRRKDGTSVPVHVVDSPVRDEHGRTVGKVGVSVDISERKAFEERLAYQATHDPLTGLPNRMLFTQRLDHALAKAGASGRAVTIMFIDLDGFKRVNDSFGHAAGDELLKAVSRRLSGGPGSDTMLARFGGDEFTMLLEDVSTPDEARERADMVLERLRTPFSMGNLDIFADASIGVAQSSTLLSNPEDVLRAADVALYQAKASGRATFRLFDPLSSSNMPARLELESDLRRAVERDELRLYFQPEVDLQTGKIVGAEALVRWQHPSKGLIAPGAFIPIAEESNLIVQIGTWVLTEACKHARTWHALGAEEQHLTVSVNLTARQLRQPDLIETVRRIASGTGMLPRQLKLEITERTVVEDVEGETNMLARLRHLGVKLAIDDFGTGYSSLGYLRKWPVDTLKIDRSFVEGVDHDRGAQSLVAAMAGLSTALGADVTAEGIETKGQLAWLRSVGIQRGQGFYFARPVPAPEFLEMLSRRTRFTVNNELERTDRSTDLETAGALLPRMHTMPV